MKDKTLIVFTFFKDRPSKFEISLSLKLFFELQYNMTKKIYNYKEIANDKFLISLIQ